MKISTFREYILANSTRENGGNADGEMRFGSDFAGVTKSRDFISRRAPRSRRFSRIELSRRMTFLRRVYPRVRPLHLCHNACLQLQHSAPSCKRAAMYFSWRIPSPWKSWSRRDSRGRTALSTSFILASLSSIGHHRISRNTHRLFPAIVWKC